MMKNRLRITQLLTQKHIFSHENQEILVCNVSDVVSGVALAKEILYTVVNKKTVLYLSGGSTPKSLYEILAKEEKLDVGAVGMVDERYGEKWHKTSNELMIKETELLRYLQMKDTTFYPILTGKDREETADQYDHTLRGLFSLYQQHVAILGVGADSHTAGLPANKAFMKEILADKISFVTSYNDQHGSYKERVTMTHLVLQMMDSLIILVFGKDKQHALDRMFGKENIEDVPSRLLTVSDIAKKAILITDQNV